MAFTANAQVKVGDNPSSIHPAAVMEMESTNKGMLLPRMTVAQRDAISNPANSMLIYNTTDGCINIYNETDDEWRSLCGDKANGSAAFDVDCSSLVVSGTYTTGVSLDPDDNFITITVNVTDLGTYNIFSNSSGMYFAATGTFTTLGSQDIVLTGQGYPLVAGTNFLALSINGNVCTTVINVANGLAVVSGCGTAGALTGTLTSNTAIDPGTVYKSYTAGPAYSGGGVFGMTSAPSNGIRISSPVNGIFSASGAPIDYILSGTPVLTGNTTINYSINGYACSFIVPVQSGSGLASAISCTSTTLAGTYQSGTAMTAGNTKLVNLTVSTAGDFYLRTETQNGVYFESAVVTLATGAQVMTMAAKGTPTLAGAFTYNVNASKTATTFSNCSFSVTFTLPATVPDFTTLSCSPLSNSVTYIKSPNTASGQKFGGEVLPSSYFYSKGTKISADGLTMAVGAGRESSAAGAVYVYVRASLTAAWTYQARVVPANAESNDEFGSSVDLANNGNTLIIGARDEDGSGTGVNPANNNSATGAGAAYVFVRSGTTWSQQAYLKANNTGASDKFGINVAISGDGNTVAVGALLEDGGGTGINPSGADNSKASAGAVYTYTRSGSTWSFDAYIKASNTDAADYFGVDVALNDDGTTLAVGAMQEDGSNIGINPLSNNSASNSGAAYVFKKTSGTWAQQAYVKAGTLAANDNFGQSVDLDGTGNLLVVGDRLENGNGKGVNPAANQSAADAGAAYVYSRSGSTWSQAAYLKSINTGNNDRFGYSVTVSNNGQFIMVGAIGEDGNAGCINAADNNKNTDIGAAYYYSLVGGIWQYSFKFKQPAQLGFSNYEYFGGCVSLSADGRSCAISASGDDGSGKGINPSINNAASNAGCVIVYTK